MPLNSEVVMHDPQAIRAALPQALADTNLPLDGKQAGKVRDWYTVDDKRRLLVTTDRLSAFDRVLARVPYKGQVLNQLSAWWFGQTADIIPNHLLSIPDPNAMLVTTVEPYLVEVIVRGYISGVTSTALWHRYSLGEREIYGYTFPEGLRKNQALPTPIMAMQAISGLMMRLVQRFDVRSAPMNPSPAAAIAAAAGPYSSRSRKMKISPAAKEFVERGIRTGNPAASIASMTPQPMRSCCAAGSIATE